MAENKETELPIATQLAFERTSMAYDRTLMAWIRTATSLISFGFTLYKFFQLDLKGKLEHGQMVGPREFGMLMIATAIFSLAMSTIQYRIDRKSLKAKCPNLPRTVVGVVAGMMAILGIVAFLSVLFNV